MPRAKNDAAKQTPMNMKTTKALRAAIEAAAADAGRSLVREVEFRIERSFVDDSLLNTVLGSGNIANMYRAIHQSIGKVERDCLKFGISGKDINTEINSAVSVITRAYFPNGENMPSDPGEPIHNRKPGDIGKRAAYEWLFFKEDMIADIISARSGKEIEEKPKDQEFSEMPLSDIMPRG